MKKNTDYTAGDSIYDGMNTNIADLKFHKQWLLKSKEHGIFNHKKTTSENSFLTIFSFLYFLDSHLNVF